MSGSLDERLDEILEGVANEYSAGHYYEHSEPLMVESAAEAIKALFLEALL